MSLPCYHSVTDRVLKYMKQGTSNINLQAAVNFLERTQSDICCAERHIWVDPVLDRAYILAVGLAAAGENILIFAGILDIKRSRPGTFQKARGSLGLSLCSMICPSSQ